MNELQLRGEDKMPTPGTVPSIGASNDKRCVRLCIAALGRVSEFRLNAGLRYRLGETIWLRQGGQTRVLYVQISFLLDGSASGNVSGSELEGKRGRTCRCLACRSNSGYISHGWGSGLSAPQNLPGYTPVGFLLSTAASSYHHKFLSPL